MITAGIECGSKNTKAVILRYGEIIGRGLVITGFDQQQSAARSLSKAVEEAGIRMEEVARIVGTGSGKDAIALAQDTVNDIRAMGRAALYFFPGARTVADVGAEEGRAVKLDERGQAVDYAINEKCAAGAGTFIEAMARALETPVEEMGPLALTSDREIPMNAQCVIFAESEVVGLIHGRTPKKDISKAIHDAMAKRIVSMIRQIGVNEDVVLMGGVGYNPGFVAAVKRELKLEKVYVPPYPDFGAAVGAALAAAES